MILLLDIAPAIYFFIPAVVIALAIAAIALAVFFLVRALRKKKGARGPEQK